MTQKSDSHRGRSRLLLPISVTLRSSPGQSSVPSSVKWKYQHPESIFSVLSPQGHS